MPRAPARARAGERRYEHIPGDFTATATARRGPGPDRVRAADGADRDRRDRRRVRGRQRRVRQLLGGHRRGRQSLMISIVVLAAGVIASWIDLRSRRVPNLLTMPLACAALLLAAIGASGLTVTDAVLGCLVGLGLMLPLHVLGGTGAGDVKLMAAFGALLGPAGVLGAFIRMAIVGGVIAIAVAIH